ncbi:MAG: PRC-barrel domain-containing protein [Pseudolabrys sp.]
MRKSAPILFTALALVVTVAPATPSERAFVIAQQTPTGADAKGDDSLQAKFNRRFPQEVKVDHLIGMPVLDDNDVTLGYVQKVARTPKGKIELIVSYSKWFGWFGRPVAVPIEAVAILARQLDSVEMKPDEYEKAPTWSQGESQILPQSDTVRVALGRR